MVGIIFLINDGKRNSLIKFAKIKPSNIEISEDTHALRIVENNFYAKSVLIEDTLSKERVDFKCDGAFLGIGHSPNSILFKDYLKLDSSGYICTGPDSTKTSIEGVFAAGDIQDHVYRQAVTAAGSGCMAAIEVERYLES